LHARLADASLHREAWNVCAAAANAPSYRNRSHGMSEDAGAISSSRSISRITKKSRKRSKRSLSIIDGSGGKKLVVEAVLHEGLGNQLFQLAFAERLALALTQHARAAAGSTGITSDPAAANAPAATASSKGLPMYRVVAVGHPDPALLPRLRALGLLYEDQQVLADTNQPSPTTPSTNHERSPGRDGRVAPPKPFARTREGRAAASRAAGRAARPSRCGSTATLSDLPTYATSARKTGLPPFVAQVRERRPFLLIMFSYTLFVFRFLSHSSPSLVLHSCLRSRPALSAAAAAATTETSLMKLGLRWVKLGWASGVARPLLGTLFSPRRRAACALKATSKNSAITWTTLETMRGPASKTTTTTTTTSRGSRQFPLW
jgi:hypothetical protein